jgi:hypothetical protein
MRESDRTSQLTHADEIMNKLAQLSFLSRSTAIRRNVVAKERYTTKGLFQHTATCKFGLTVRASGMAAATLVMILGMLSLSITTAQICVNPVLGQARYGLTAASLPSGLVFFAGGFSGLSASIKRVVICNLTHVH